MHQTHRIELHDALDDAMIAEPTRHIAEIIDVRSSDMLSPNRAGRAVRSNVAGLVAATFSLVVGFSTPGRAAAIMVNTAADDDGQGTTCSLREAIRAANVDAAYGGCTAGRGADYIWFAPATARGPVLLTREEPLLVTSKLTIDGTSVVIRGAPRSGGIVVEVDAAALTHLKMTGFGGAPALTVIGTAILENSEIVDNVATGASPTAGIWVKPQGTLFAERVVFRNNAGASGGAIHNSGGNVTLVEAIIAGNESTLFGGGLVNTAGGNMAIKNSTISGNVAHGSYGGGIYTGVDSTTNIDGTTIVNNGAKVGAALYASLAGHAVVSLRDSVVADNVADDDASTNGCFGSVFSYAGNRMGAADACVLVRTTGARGPADAVGPGARAARPSTSFVPVAYVRPTAR